MKETAKINASMLQLGQCLKQLRENCDKKQKESKTFVAFRNSKLTHLFQNVLQGSGRAVMIVNIASDCRVTDETFNALKLSAVAQKICTNASQATELPKIIPQTPAFGKKYKFIFENICKNLNKRVINCFKWLIVNDCSH